MTEMEKMVEEIKSVIDNIVTGNMECDQIWVTELNEVISRHTKGEKK